MPPPRCGAAALSVAVAACSALLASAQLNMQTWPNTAFAPPQAAVATLAPAIAFVRLRKVDGLRLLALTAAELQAGHPDRMRSGTRRVRPERPSKATRRPA